MQGELPLGFNGSVGNQQTADLWKNDELLKARTFTSTSFDHPANYQRVEKGHLDQKSKLNHP